MDRYMIGAWLGVIGSMVMLGVMFYGAAWFAAAMTTGILTK